jgi:hypothetical protein
MTLRQGNKKLSNLKEKRKGRKNINKKSFAGLWDKITTSH